MTDIILREDIMDDIYFSDKKKRSSESDKNSRRYSPNEFTDTDYFDESFSLDFKRTGSSQAFSDKDRFIVHLPDEDSISEGPADRTPKGRPVSSSGGQSQDEVVRRVPSSSHGRSSDTAHSAVSHTRPAPPAPQRSRTPQGARVNQPQHQKPVRMSREGSHRSAPPPKPPVSKRKVIALSFLGVFMALFIGLLGYGISALQGLNYDDTIVPNAYVDESTLASSDDVINILFIGSDARSEVEGQRSDTMMLFSIDKLNKKLKLTSFLRDSYVYIPSKKYSTKLNAAFSYGGTQLVMDTLEYNFGVKIDHYIMVDFKAFRQLVNLLGGITVEGVTKAEAKYMREEVKIKNIKEGTNKMNGKAALWYCRIRYVDNDFRRTERQRKVIGAIVNKALKTNPFKLMSIVKEVLPNISTDINSSELIGLAAGAALRYIHYDIEQQQIPAEDTWTDARISGQLVLKMDLEKNKEILKSFLYDKNKK